MSIVIALLIFTVIIVIHELGHFLLAKRNGIYVTEFSVGMGPRILTIVKTKEKFTLKLFASGDYVRDREDWKDRTKYSWKLLPLGGSCAMLGEDEELEDERSFNKKGVWARISVVAAGPIFNFILAFILSIVIIGSIGFDPAKISLVYDDMPMAKAGIQQGDVITSINGTKIHFSREISTYLTFQPLDGSPVEITFERDGEEHTVTVIPEKMTKEEMDVRSEPTIAKEYLKILEEYSGSASFSAADLRKAKASLTESANKEISVDTKSAESAERYYLGFSYSTPREKTGFTDTLKYSVYEVKYWIVTTVKSLGQMLAGKVSKDDIAGPVGIVQIIGDTYNESRPAGAWATLINMFNISILLSANLGVMNLLPLPALDGGRLVFLLIEVIRRKPVPQEKEGMVHMIGLILLLILMGFIMFNDIARIFR